MNSNLTTNIFTTNAEIPSMCIKRVTFRLLSELIFKNVVIKFKLELCSYDMDVPLAQEIVREIELGISRQEI